MTGGSFGSVETEEVARELGEILAGGPPPFVDGLVGITDGGDGEASAEDGEQQLPLGCVGVLVLIEQENLISSADTLGDIGMIIHQAIGETNEVGIVDRPDALLGFVVADQRLRQLGPCSLDVAGAAGREGDGVDQVVPELAGQLGEVFHPAPGRRKVDDPVGATTERVPQ